MREWRERQREMVEAILRQRDMYRTLLAQSTPLPLETGPAHDETDDATGGSPVAIVMAQVDTETS